MDNTKEFTVVEWCAGYCGISTGLKRVVENVRVIAYAEIEAFAIANLVDKIEAGRLDAAPIWTDIKTFPNREFYGKVDCLIAGYPCQPFSAAGKRQGKDDPRHLWPFIRTAIGVMRPRYCFFENVEGHISLGLSTVISDLEEDGYKTTWGIFSAAEVGAPHRRKRVFILGHSNIPGQQTLRNQPKRKREERLTGEPSQLAHRHSERLERLWQCNTEEGWEEQNGHIRSCRQVWPARPGEQQYEWEPPRII